MKTKLAGWKKICGFTYTQSMKSKAMKITIGILCAIALFSMPLASVIGGISSSEEEEASSLINKVYIYDNTNLIGEQFANGSISSELYNNIEYVKDSDNSSSHIDEIINRDDNADEVFLEINYCDDINDLNYGINIMVYYSSSSEITPEDADNFSFFIYDNVKASILKSAGVSDEQISQMVKSITYNVIHFNAMGEVADDDESISQFQYYLSLVVICVLIFMVSFVGSKVSELIVTEKATRVMEYILTSIKPMAILVGKVIGSTLVMLTMVCGIVISFILSILLNTALFPAEDGKLVLPSLLKELMENGAVTGATPVNIFLIILLLITGYLFYGIIAGIAGATVSKVEEMAEGMKIFTFTMMIGAYLPLFFTMSNSIGGSDWGVFTYVVYLLPVSSMFILPQYLILGKVSTMVVLGAVGTGIIGIFLVLLLVNKVYEHMLYSNGAILTVKDIIGFAKEGKGEKNGK